MQVPAAPFFVGEPLLDLRCLVRGQVVQHDVHGQAVRDGGVDLVEEPQDFFGGVALLAVRQDLTGRHVYRCEQVGRAVALVVVGHRAGPAGDYRQAWLGAVHRLPLGQGRRTRSAPGVGTNDGNSHHSCLTISLRGISRESWEREMLIRS